MFGRTFAPHSSLRIKVRQALAGFPVPSKPPEPSREPGSTIYFFKAKTQTTPP